MERPKEGDLVIIEKNGQKWEGQVLPGQGPAITLKLKSGYNVGLELDKGTKVTKTGEVETVRHKPVGFKQEFDKNKPLVSILSAGGTIASSIDYSTGAISATYSADDLVRSVPEISNFANIRTGKIFDEMSENLSPSDWRTIARSVFEEIRQKEIAGAIVTHGTDTLSFTSSALSFMLRNLNKPVILTYAQKSSDRGSTDSAMNLICSAVAATTDIAEVVTVGHGTISDDFCLINRGNKVRKMHSSQRNTFRPINTLPIAKAWPDGKVEFVGNYKKKSMAEGEPYLADKLEEKVAIIKFYPGLDPAIIDWYIDRKYKGIIIEGTGLGHVAMEKRGSLLPSIERALESKIIVGMTTQTIYGSVNAYVYSNLRRLSERGVVYLMDMTTEAAYAKLMWVLGQTQNEKEAKEMMLKNIAGEFNPRLQPELFLY
ncbi:MAG: Glu-tRNA(Gln) amidotransferase subunit GatD [Candidatus Aenigmarchaeota archaeon]|nr:Glu-tRNA(Gln) amidotransferase subunit GatD [Candidatus Aenigmarchaeota archaeon]